MVNARKEPGFNAGGPSKPGSQIDSRERLQREATSAEVSGSADRCRWSPVSFAGTPEAGVGSVRETSMGGHHGLWTRRTTLVTRRSTADHHSAGSVLAPLGASANDFFRLQLALGQIR